jgi:hypothetical protein
MITRQINNYGQPIVGTDGLPVANLHILFRLTDAGYNPAGTFDVVSGERILPQTVEAITDANGEFAVDLWPTSRGQDARMWVCEERWPEQGRKYFAAPLVEGAAPLSWYSWKLSGWVITGSEVSSFALHVQDNSIHGQTTLAPYGTDYAVMRIRNIKLMTTTPVPSDFDGPGSIILVYTP